MQKGSNADPFFAFQLERLLDGNANDDSAHGIADFEVFLGAVFVFVVAVHAGFDDAFVCINSGEIFFVAERLFFVEVFPGVIDDELKTFFFDIGFRTILLVDGPERQEGIGKTRVHFLRVFGAHAHHHGGKRQSFFVLIFLGRFDDFLVLQAVDDFARVHGAICGNDGKESVGHRLR